MAAAPRGLPRGRRAGARAELAPRRTDRQHPRRGPNAYEPLGADLWSCANAAAGEEPGEPPSLAVEAEEGTLLPELPLRRRPRRGGGVPGAAELLFAPLEGAGFPVDAVLHADWVGNREALGQVRKRILDVEHAYREQLAGSAAGPGYAAEEDRELAREYEAVLASTSRPPMLRAWISPGCGGARPRGARAPGRRRFRERFGDVALHRPRGSAARPLPRPPAARPTAARSATTASR